MKDLANKVAIVTGSSSGVGAAKVKQLAALGCHSVVNYNSNSAGADAVAAECEKAGVETVIMQANVAKDEDCRAMANAAIEKWGRIDILVNNAGTTKFVDHNDLEGLSSDDFQNIYSVNVIGAYQMTRAVAEQMKQQEEVGSIVNVASIAGVAGVGSCIAYAASKGAMITMTLSLARVLGPEVRVNVVCPGFIEGEWLKQGLGEERYEQARQAAIKSAPLGVTASSDTVAESILYFIQGPIVVTGESLIIDGGRHLGMTPLTRR
ncbi:MAG: SDR family oxidoreductase [Pseudomonadales bacterium]|nr:SDR family oxidoreductase [Pseudomonadales bacterium]